MLCAVISKRPPAGVKMACGNVHCVAELPRNSFVFITIHTLCEQCTSLSVIQEKKKNCNNNDVHRPSHLRVM